MPLANELALSAAITTPSLILTETRTVMSESIFPPVRALHALHRIADRNLSSARFEIISSRARGPNQHVAKRGAGAVLEARALVFGLQDVAVMSEPQPGGSSRDPPAREPLEDSPEVTSTVGAGPLRPSSANR